MAFRPAQPVSPRSNGGSTQVRDDVRREKVRSEERRILFERRTRELNGRGANGGKQPERTAWQNRVRMDRPRPDDLKNLNCVFTRVHWQQDRRVLDYCDRHGIFIQSEVPTWGPEYVQGDERRTGRGYSCKMDSGTACSEMIARDRNHPCDLSRGAYAMRSTAKIRPLTTFAQAHARRDQRVWIRGDCCSYASNISVAVDP